MSDDFVLMGRVAGVYGIKGYAKIHSYTRPIENILKYKTWQLRLSGNNTVLKLADARKHGQGLIARFVDIDDRDVVKQFTGADILVARKDMPRLAADEIYWSDLVGLDVFNLQDEYLGHVVEIQETGANDVFVVEDATGEKLRRLIPWVTGEYLQSIDVEAGKLIVDWLKDYDQ